MALHDTDALIIETDTAAESLPAPATVPGRTHDLTNTGTVTAVWSGGVGFTEGGANVASISVGRGQSKRVQSDGARWIVLPLGTARRVFAGKGVTDASGNVTFTFTPAFPTVPVITQAVETAITDVTECRLTAVAVGSATFNVRRSPSATVLGISLLQVPIPAAGVTVHCLATEAGQGV
ncbi:hypothetical protein GCM10010387_15540 [Streptomyces inusitatus]|uniref:Uncharacterized protein n=1 Tax=Streptomyces inusitatus TaxID=68221 RepID=A0A918PV89_9ACTN|nr:hypothetical protein [Streptomyces inusitatus]GGZ23308.1 hypothetical protein GCM10010387_15540 [Streptomyces inusitatus]